MDLHQLGYVPTTLAQFASRQNAGALRSALMRELADDPVARSRIDACFAQVMQNFIARHRRIGQDMVYNTNASELARVPLACMNAEFVQQSADFLRGESRAPCNEELLFDYVADTNVPAAVRPAMSSTDTLDKWRRGVARPGQMLDDDNFRATESAVPLVYYYNENPDLVNANRHAALYDLNDPSMYGPGNQVHDEALWFRQMNRDLYESTPIGYANPQAEARLMSRNIFRKGAGGVPNAIPQREINLVRRNIDRNIDEGLRGTERTGISLGYDMEPLRRMTAAKRESEWRT